MEALGQLTGGVAHDFNNLLAVIMGNAQLMQRRLEKTNPLLEAIHRAGTRGAELTHRLLAFSRRQPLRPKATSIRELLDEVSGLLPSMLEETIEIDVCIHPGTWDALVDRGQLCNAILNLVINARDAMPSGGDLSVACDNRVVGVQSDDPDVPPPGEHVRIAASDTGCGMSQEIAEQAFEPFFTTKNVAKGSGLGLSMVYGFVSQSGGHASIQSVEEAGTDITLYPRRATSDTESGFEDCTGVVARGRGERVLVVEDEPGVREMVVGMLTDLGYRVIAAANARQVNDRLDASPGPPDVLLTDMVLPGGISGPDPARAFQLRYPNARVVFMSGYPMRHKETGLGGAIRESHFLSQPFTEQELAARTRSALRDTETVP